MTKDERALVERCEACQVSRTDELLCALVRRLDAENERLKALLPRIDKWMGFAATPLLKDHACADCFPDGDMLVKGWYCALHEVRRALAGPEPQDGKEV